MFIDHLDEKYSDRILLCVDVDHTNFTVAFDLPDSSCLKITISVLQQNKQLTVSEAIREMKGSRMVFSKVNVYLLNNDVEPILLLKKYLLESIGDVEEHTYEGSFAASIVESLKR